MSDIYRDGTYFARHPTLHEEDSGFKFEGVVEFLDLLQFRDRKIRLVDVGGGAGRLGFLVADYLHDRGCEIEFAALDLSDQMLALQKKNNPYIKKTLNMSLIECEKSGFDLALMMDVVEHIPRKHEAAEKADSMSEYIIYNIPVEINFFDVLKNLYMHGRYYRLQKKSLGHVHFFSYLSCRRFIKRHHELIRCKFVGYCRHILSSDAPNHVRLRNNRLMALELQLSLWIWKHLRPLAPYLIQGTAFILVKTNAKTDH